MRIPNDASLIRNRGTVPYGSSLEQNQQLHLRPSVRSNKFLLLTMGEMQPRDIPEKLHSNFWSDRTGPHVTKAKFPVETFRTPLFTTTEFHVLLKSFFKILFNLPSWYLFAIWEIFRLMRFLPRVE